jgi:glyoxylase-like metal-dependent hydrolase (beta-lactamase superfamily II)
MKIMNLTAHSLIYTSNVFLVLGDWNSLNDVNTLIDVGSDLSILPIINSINTGLGKKKIDQVILTHSHSDHTSILPVIKNEFKPVVYAFNSHLQGSDKNLVDGNFLKIGDRYFEVFHITAHSYDSICLYNDVDEVLFSGDTSFPVVFENEEMQKQNHEVLKRLARKKIRTVCSGHGGVQDFSKRTFNVCRK